MATPSRGPATLSAARDTAPRPVGVSAGEDVDLKGGGGDDDGRRSCNAVGCGRQGAAPEGGEGSQRRRFQGGRRR